jgi:hypothetical protein
MNPQRTQPSIFPSSTLRLQQKYSPSHLLLYTISSWLSFFRKFPTGTFPFGRLSSEERDDTFLGVYVTPTENR